MKMSVKWKIIGIVITIVIIGLSSLATISSIIISNKTEEGVVDQKGASGFVPKLLLLIFNFYFVASSKYPQTT